MNHLLKKEFFVSERLHLFEDALRQFLDDDTLMQYSTNYMCTALKRCFDWSGWWNYLFTDLFRIETMLLLELLTDTKSHWQGEVTMMKKTLLITFYAMLACCSWNRLCAEDPPRNQCTQWAKIAIKVCCLSTTFTCQRRPHLDSLLLFLPWSIRVVTLNINIA